VQQEVASAIERVTGVRPTLIGASRTDAGVHALGQSASFRTESRIPAGRLVHALNFYLPPDVKVRRARDAASTFHAQFDARAKTYRYTVLNGSSPRPLLRRTAVLVRGRLDEKAMRRAARHFVGRHDFRAFGSEPGSRKTTVRTIYELKIARRGDLVVFEVTGDGFLYNMVRAVVGTLLRAGQGRLAPSEARRIIDEGDRRAAGPVVGPEGLVLVRVSYVPWKKKSRSSTSSRA
jgi:tRNA pseudouridine38-40 synthase